MYLLITFKILVKNSNWGCSNPYFKTIKNKNKNKIKIIVPFIISAIIKLISNIEFLLCSCGDGNIE
jgi:hypothetical protein